MKRVIIVIAISIVSEVAVAQWKFSVSLSMNGCGGSLEERVAVKAAEAQVNHWMGEGFVTFPSKMECEQSRHNVMSFSFNEGNCKIRFIASPCTGSGGMSNDVDVLGVSKGSAFYSTNPVNEINDWSNDDMERMLALNPDFHQKEPKTVATGDLAFDDLIENMPYSNVAFSGRMSRGSTGLIQSNGEFAWSTGQPVKRGVVVPENFTGRPFDYEEEERRSEDLSFIKINLPPVGPHTGTGVDDEGVLSKALNAIDTRLDWYRAEDGNVLQYLYTKGKENVVNVGYWWNNSEISSKISYTLETVVGIIKSDAINASIKKIIPSEGEDAYDIYDTVGSSIKDLIKEGLNPEVITNKAMRGETLDTSKYMMKFSDEINGLAGRIAESHGMPNTSLKNYLDMPKDYLEHQSVRMLDPFHIISD